MPKIAGINIVGVVLATLAFYVVGAVVYGALFTQAWMDLHGFTEESFEGQNAGLSMAIGFLNALVTVTLLAVVRRMLEVESLMQGLRAALLLWVGFAVTSLAYDTIYALSPIGLLLIDAAHLLVAYVLAMIVLHFFD